ncbi:MAG: hypothetical protein KGL39_08975 [Patescibacteria group bacterium]|nr:hypothetical protein [Patescibacteria group bacterium]
MSTTDPGNLLDGGPDFDLADMLGLEINRQQQQQQQQQSAPSAGPTPPANGAPAPDEQLRRANEVLAQQMAQQQREIEDLRARQARYPNADGPTNQLGALPAPAQLTQSWEQIRQQLNERALTDPAGVILEIQQASQQALLGEVKKLLGPLATSSVSLEIQNYRSEMSGSDVDFKAAQSEFDTYLSNPATQQALAQMDPQSRRGALDMIYAAAVTQGRRKLQVSAEHAEVTARREIPPYSVGVQYAAGETVNPNVKYSGKPLNAVQREILRSAEIAGINDPKRIKQMLDDAAEG